MSSLPRSRRTTQHSSGGPLSSNLPRTKKAAAVCCCSFWFGVTGRYSATLATLFDSFVDRKSMAAVLSRRERGWTILTWVRPAEFMLMLLNLDDAQVFDLLPVGQIKLDIDRDWPLRRIQSEGTAAQVLVPNKDREFTIPNDYATLAV